MNITTLKNKSIQTIYVSSEEFLFVDTDNIGYLFGLYADCCSTSLFYDFFGVNNLLENGNITDVKEIEITAKDTTKTEGGYSEKDLSSEGDCIQVYGYQFTTISPQFGEVTSVFSFRNYSNGYYGGDLADGIELQDIELQNAISRLNPLIKDTHHINVLTNKPE